MGITDSGDRKSSEGLDARLTRLRYARPQNDGSTLTAAETLLVIDIVNSGDQVLLQTVWAVSPDIVARRRRTDIETILDEAFLLRRLAKLVPVLIAGDLLPATTTAAA